MSAFLGLVVLSHTQLFNYSVSYNATLSRLSECVSEMMQPLSLGPDQPLLYVLPGEVEAATAGSPKLIALQVRICLVNDGRQETSQSKTVSSSIIEQAGIIVLSSSHTADLTFRKMLQYVYA